MAGTLDYVQKGEAITAEKWNALVERINALEQRRSFDFRVPVRVRPQSGGSNVALCSINSNNWTLDEENYYYTTATLLDAYGQSSGKTIEVYAPYYATSHPGVVAGSRWYVVFIDDRWTLIPRSGALSMSLSNNVLTIEIS